jgi:hypothetical protein
MLGLLIRKEERKQKKIQLIQPVAKPLSLSDTLMASSTDRGMFKNSNSLQDSISGRISQPSSPFSPSLLS